MKTSLTFLESEYGRINSGNPGYILGKPILIGKMEAYETVLSDGSVATTNYSGKNCNGFPLRGADNQGQCYYIGQAISNDI